MVKSLLLIFLLIFAVSGICEFIFLIKLLFHFPGKRFKIYTFIALESGYAVRQLDYVWQKIYWHGDGYSNGIIAIIDALDENEILTCEKYINNKNIFLCTKRDVPEHMNLQGEE